MPRREDKGKESMSWWVGPLGSCEQRPRLGTLPAEELHVAERPASIISDGGFLSFFFSCCPCVYSHGFLVIAFSKEVWASDIPFIQ